MRRPLLLLLMTAFCISVLAVTSGGVSAAAKNISTSYKSATSFDGGTLVGLTGQDSDTVEASNTTNASKVVGVVVQADNSLVAVNPNEDTTQVATSGTAYVLVSDVNGRVKSGDGIAVSPFSGIGMKQVAKGYIVGIAKEDFATSADSTKKQQVTDKNGKSRTVTIGYVKADITPRFEGEAGDQKLSGLQSYVRSLTGHVVSMPRVIASLVIAVATIIGVGVLLYASIYGSIMSIGRNPLAKNSILAALLQALAMVLVSVVLAGLLIFMLLR